MELVSYVSESRSLLGAIVGGERCWVCGAGGFLASLLGL